jgi:Rrf2 family protein
MLGISRQTDYACRVLLHLALSEPGARVTTGQIAERRLIPASLVRRIVTQLSLAGLVKTARGTDGGVELARPAAEISVLDVVQAIEGPLALNPCTQDPNLCQLMPVCPVHQTWCKARANLEAELARATFDKLAVGGQPLAG